MSSSTFTASSRFGLDSHLHSQMLELQNLNHQPAFGNVLQDDLDCVSSLHCVNDPCCENGLRSSKPCQAHQTPKLTIVPECNAPQRHPFLMFPLMPHDPAFKALATSPSHVIFSKPNPEPNSKHDLKQELEQDLEQNFEKNLEQNLEQNPETKTHPLSFQTLSHHIPNLLNAECIAPSFASAATPTRQALGVMHEMRNVEHRDNMRDMSAAVKFAVQTAKSGIKSEVAAKVRAKVRAEAKMGITAHTDFCAQVEAGVQDGMREQVKAGTLCEAEPHDKLETRMGTGTLVEAGSSVGAGTHVMAKTHVGWETFKTTEPISKEPEKSHHLVHLAHKYAEQGYALLTHSFSHSFGHSLGHSFAHAVVHSVAHPFTSSVVHSVAHSVTHSLTHLDHWTPDWLHFHHEKEASHHSHLKPDLCVFGLGLGLLFNGGCSVVNLEQDELLSLEPLDNYKERLNKLPECNQSETNARCVVHAVDTAGDVLMLPYFDGRIEGMTLSLFANGQIKAAYSYQHGQRNGVFSTFYEDGTEKTSGYYLENQLQGTVKNSYPSGITQSITSYERNVKNGLFTTFNQDGRQFSVSLYLNAKLQNPITTFLESGDVLSTYYYQGRLIKAETAKQNGEHETFVYLNTHLNGFAQLFYANGQLKRSVKIENGHKQGFGTRYYANGQIQGLYHYEKGKLHGRTLRYTSDGNMQLILNYYQDRLESGSCGNGTPLNQAQLDEVQKDPFAPYPNLCSVQTQTQAH